MKLGIGGRKAIVCAASKGLGRAAAFSLAREGVELTLIARTRETLEATAAELRAETGVKVTVVTGDLATEAARDAVLAACPSPDILVTNPGSRQTPADFRTLTRDDWIRWFDEHTLSALGLIQRAAEGMCTRKFGRIVNISVSFVKFPQIGFAHSHGARAHLSAATASISSRTSEARTTSAPSRAKRSAVERPMPRPAPVIRATFPCSFIPNPSPSGESMLAARTGRSERNGSTTWNEGGQGGARKRAVSDAGTDSRWAPTSGRRGRASCRCPPPDPGGLPRSPRRRHRPVAAAR